MAASKSISRGHPVKHRAGPVRSHVNTRSSVTSPTAKNTVASPTKRGVRSPANVVVSGVGSPTRATNVVKTSTSGGVRTVPNNARSL